MVKITIVDRWVMITLIEQVMVKITLIDRLLAKIAIID